MLLVTRNSSILQLEWHHCAKGKTNLVGPSWETPSFEKSVNLWNCTSLFFAYNVIFLQCDATSSQYKESWCLKFHDPSLTFLIPMSRVMLGLRVLGVKGLVWLWQMRNPIDEVLNSIQDIVSAQLKRTNTPKCCTTETTLGKEPPLNNLFLQGAGFAR